LADLSKTDRLVPQEATMAASMREMVTYEKKRFLSAFKEILFVL
jgi:hypothetical protein